MTHTHTYVFTQAFASITIGAISWEKKREIDKHVVGSQLISALRKMREQNTKLINGNWASNTINLLILSHFAFVYARTHRHTHTQIHTVRRQMPRAETYKFNGKAIKMAKIENMLM